MQRYKYPRTLHLPWSLGKSQDDRVLRSVDHFNGKEIVVTEKLDGENTTLYRDYIHARSIDGQSHPSRNLVKALQAQIGYQIPSGWRMCGENLYAKHSIYYRNLPSYFLVFAVYDESNICLSWDDTVHFSASLGLSTVPVLYRGLWDRKAVERCFSGESVFSGSQQEGYVVRMAAQFAFEDHTANTGKFVRANHVQTDEHWQSQPVQPNSLENN